MKIFVAKDYEELGTIAYGYIKEIVLTNSRAILGLATGSSPLGIYRLMAEDCAQNNLSYKDIRTVNLDEYVGLSATHDQSYRYFMQTNLFDKIDILSQNTFVPDGTADPAAECLRYDALLDTLPRDIQLLGIGTNGHIAFNEPGTPFDSRTHTVTLDPSTIDANARFFQSASEVPRRAITMGMKDIMAAKRLLLVATGTNKADAIATALKQTPDPSCPASILQNHNDVVIVLDQGAASKLKF